MPKVRFLQSAALISLNKTMNYNDELFIEDVKLAQLWAKKGLVDILIEEEIAPKPAPKVAKTRKKKGE
jgi:hypothetical protein